MVDKDGSKGGGQGAGWCVASYAERIKNVPAACGKGRVRARMRARALPVACTGAVHFV
jgi:hypothetical protein